MKDLILDLELQSDKWQTEYTYIHSIALSLRLHGRRFSSPSGTGGVVEVWSHSLNSPALQNAYVGLEVTQWSNWSCKRRANYEYTVRI